ncbi:MAG: Flp family type IVb pilin [Alphaproteobacteria bacterium]
MLTIYSKLKTKLAQFKEDDRGASAVEYALIIAAISLVIAAAAFSLGDEVAAQFTAMTTTLTGG